MTAGPAARLLDCYRRIEAATAAQAHANVQAADTLQLITAGEYAVPTGLEMPNAPIASGSGSPTAFATGSGSPSAFDTGSGAPAGFANGSGDILSTSLPGSGGFTPSPVLPSGFQPMPVIGSGGSTSGAVTFSSDAMMRLIAGSLV